MISGIDMADLQQYSRFNSTPEIIIDGNETFGVWVEPSWIREKPDDSKISVFRVTNIFEGRPDLISENLYGTPKLAWVLIAFNARYNRTDPDSRRALNWPKAGVNILYPIDSIVFPEII